MIPQKPRSTKPFKLILAVREAMQHPQVVTAGITATDKGEWALRLTYRPEDPIPEDDLPQLARGFPALIEEVGEMPTAE